MTSNLCNSLTNVPLFHRFTMLNQFLLESFNVNNGFHFVCLVNNKNNAFLYYYKTLNLGQSDFNCLKGDQINNYCKIFKSKHCRPIL